MQTATRHTVADLRAVLQIAADHLNQYRAYAEEMRHIGRGPSISSPYQPETLASIIDAHLNPPTSAPTPTPQAVPVDIDSMTDEQLKAYRKRTAPGTDVDFVLRYAQMSADLRAQFTALRDCANADGSLKRGINRTEFYRQHCALLASWRREANARARVDATEQAA